MGSTARVLIRTRVEGVGRPWRRLVLGAYRFLLGSYLSSSSYRPLCPAQYIPRRPDEYYAACGDWISWEHFLSVPVGKEADDLESLTPKVRTDLERRAERMTARWEERRKCDDADES